MSLLSGWCSGPTGSIPKCSECRSHNCACKCHLDAKRHVGRSDAQNVLLCHTVNTLPAEES